MKEALFGIKAFDNVNQTTKIAKESNSGEDQYDDVVLNKSVHFAQLDGCFHFQRLRETG